MTVDQPTTQPGDVDAIRRQLNTLHDPGVTEPTECGRCNEPLPCETAQLVAELADHARQARELLHRAVDIRQYGDMRSGAPGSAWQRWDVDAGVFLRQPGGDDART